MGLSKELSYEAGSFSCCCNPHRIFQPEVLRLYLPALEPQVARSVWLPSFSSWFIHTQMWDWPLLQPPPGLICQPGPHLPQSSSHCLARSLLCPSCLSLSLLPVWMKVSSLTPWLWDFLQFIFLMVLVIFKFVVVLLLVV